MTRCYLPNFDFEHHLAAPGRALPKRLSELNESLAPAWLAIAEPGDAILTTAEWSQEWRARLAPLGLDTIILAPSITTIPRAELIPWGWTENLLAAASREDLLTIACIRWANSRRTSAAWEAAWGIAPEGAVAADSVSAAEAAIAHLDPTRGWVIKAEFGMSARERILGRGPLWAESRAWVERRVANGGLVFVEPWLDRVDEVGLQFDVPATEAVRFIGAARMLVGSSGQYAGSWFIEPQLQAEPWWSAAVLWATKAAEELQRGGYTGPLGIDAMQYRDADGLRVRPLQDINARWTMGRLALGWRSKLPQINRGCWWHGSAAAWHAGAPRDVWPEARGVIRTSPEVINGRPAEHVTALLLDGPIR